MALLETSEPMNDRRLNALLTISATVAVVIILATIIAGPKILSSASTTKEIKRGNEIGGCRAGYRADVDDASSKLQTSRVDIDVALSEALSAISIRDSAAFLTATEKGVTARHAELKAAAELERATDRYAELIRQSRDDPAAFLKVCRSEAR